MQSKFVRRRAAFTLVELLVVIGIIAVLIAILMPALNKARIQGQRTQCQSNIRQIGQAIYQYATANNDILVPVLSYVGDFQGPGTADDLSYSWGETLVYGKYLSSPVRTTGSLHYRTQYRGVFVCPSYGEGAYEYSGSDFIKHSGYGTSRSVWGSDYYPYYKLRWVRPDRPMIADATYTRFTPHPTSMWRDNGIFPRHMGGSNFLFKDGHVEWAKNWHYDVAKYFSPGLLPGKTGFGKY